MKCSGKTEKTCSWRRLWIQIVKREQDIYNITKEKPVDVLTAVV